MRKNVKSLKWVLWIIVATFIISIFFIWGGAGRLGEANRTNALAYVGRERSRRTNTSRASVSASTP
jgi:hypothetical protein